MSADIATGGTAALDLVLDGAGGLTKLGGGTLALGGANTYTGLTDIQVGILDVHIGSALGAIGAGNDTLMHDGAALALSGDIVVPEAISFSGRGTTIDPGQALSTSPIPVLFGNPTLSGPLNLSADASIATTVLSDLRVTGTVGTNGGPRELIVYGNTLHIDHDGQPRLGSEPHVVQSCRRRNVD